MFKSVIKGGDEPMFKNTKKSTTGYLKKYKNQVGLSSKGCVTIN